MTNSYRIKVKEVSKNGTPEVILKVIYGKDIFKIQFPGMEIVEVEHNTPEGPWVLIKTLRNTAELGNWQLQLWNLQAIMTDKAIRDPLRGTVYKNQFWDAKWVNENTIQVWNDPSEIGYNPDNPSFAIRLE